MFLKIIVYISVQQNAFFYNTTFAVKLLVPLCLQERVYLLYTFTCYLNIYCRYAERAQKRTEHCNYEPGVRWVLSGTFYVKYFLT